MNDSGRKKVVLGIIITIAGIVAYMYWQNKKAASQQQAQQGVPVQMPTAAAAQYYTVPPDVAAQVDNTGGLNFPGGVPSDTYITMSTPNPLPTNTNTTGTTPS